MMLMMMKSTFLLDMLITNYLLLCMSTPIILSSDQAIEMPITTFGDPSSTIHLVPVELGTPPQTLHLLADTGSDATWVFCDGNPPDHESDHHHRTFYHSRSSTFRFLHCSSPWCDADAAATATNRCSTPWEPCPYAYEYEDDSSTAGAWATETLTVRSIGGSEVKMDNVIIGCSDRRRTNFSDADGVLALSANYPSLTSQVAHKSFSLGLADGDHLTFGENKRTDFSREEMQYVELVNAADHPTFFFVQVLSLSVDDVELDIPKNVWEYDDRYRSGGVILDTGTTSTYVAGAAYRAIRAYFVEFFRDYDNVELSGSNICFSSYAPEGFLGVRLPRVSVEFEGGARLEPTAEGVYYEDEDGMSCLAIWPVDEGEASVIGSGMQKGYLWEYDLVKRRAGFVPLRQQLRRNS